MWKWDLRFLNRAKELSGWSKDPSTKVGACITRGKFEISSGYNGFPAGVLDDESLLNDRPTKLARTIHGEVNAILAAKQNLDECTIYVYPMQPCSNCAAAIIQSGIKRVVTLQPTPTQLTRWGESFFHANTMFNEAGVDVIYYDKTEVFPPEPKLCECGSK